MRIRSYEHEDEASWLLCRLLAFFDTTYYDDVKIERTQFDNPAVRLVADIDSTIVGLIDVEIDGPASTIDCVAVHPNHQRAGIAHALLHEAMARLPPDVETIDAWTREDEPALRWYSASGFTEQFRYLHVYKGPDDPDDGFSSPPPLSSPVIAFCHAPIDKEQELRARHRRIYICRQLVRSVKAE